MNPYSNIRLGNYNQIVRYLVATPGLGTYAGLSGLNQGWGARFVAQSSNNISGVWLLWGSLGNPPPTIQLSIEPIETAAGKPSGVPYDVNAITTFTPTGSAFNLWQFVSFPTKPTGNLIVNNPYWIVLVTTQSGASTPLGAYVDSSLQPAAESECTDGRPQTVGRSNFTINATRNPVALLTLDDGSIVNWGMCQFGSSSTIKIFGPTMMGTKFIVPSGQKWSINGIGYNYFSKNGTIPSSGDLVSYIYGDSNTPIASSVMNQCLFLSNYSMFNFIPDVVLTSGTYRAVFCMNYGLGSTSIYYGFRYGIAKDTSVVQTSLTTAGTSNNLGNPISWDLDVSSGVPGIELFFSDISTVPVNVSGSTTIINNSLLYNPFGTQFIRA